MCLPAPSGTGPTGPVRDCRTTGPAPDKKKALQGNHTTSSEEAKSEEADVSDLPRGHFDDVLGRQKNAFFY